MSNAHKQPGKAILLLFNSLGLTAFVISTMLCLLTGNAKAQQNYSYISGPTSVCLGGTYEYTYETNLMYPRRSTFTWDVSPNGSLGTTASSYTNSITWSSPGSAVVTLTVRNQAGLVLDVVYLNVTVEYLPAPALIPLNNNSCHLIDTTGLSPERITYLFPNGFCATQACAYSTASYTVSGYSGSSFDWSVSGGTPAGSTTGNTISVNWGASGQGLITIKETSASGCVGTRSFCVNILEAPQAKFSFLPEIVNKSETACLEQNIIFKDESTASYGSPIVSWFWDFGDGTPIYSSSTPVNPEHIYTRPGAYEVKLTVTNACGCSTTFRRRINVREERLVNIICPAVVCEGQRVTYSLSEPQLNCERADWSIIGGTINAQSPNNVSVVWDRVDENGFGYVTFSGACERRCVGATTVKIPVVQANGIIKGPATICEDEKQVLYRLPAWPGTFYNWSIYSKYATISNTDQSNEIVVKPNGAEVVRLVCKYKCEIAGCEGSAVIEIRITAKPVITGPGSICVNNSATYTIAGITGSWNWKLTGPGTNVTGGTNATSYTTPSLATAGQYTININTGSFCAPDSKTFQVENRPAPPTSIEGEQYICLNTPYTYTAEAPVAGTNFEWTVNGGTATINPAGNTATITFLSGGPFTISVVRIKSGSAGGGCTSLPLTYNVYKDVPTPHITGNTTPCPSSYATYSAGYTRGDVYEWEIIPNELGSVMSGNNTNNIEVLWNNTAGSGWLIVKVTRCGTIKRDTLVVGVNGLPPAMLSSATQVCSGAVLNISNTIPFGITAKWDFGDGYTQNFTNAPTVNHTYKNTTSASVNYTISVTYTDACGNNKLVTRNISVLPAPAVALSPSGGYIECNTGFSHTLTATLQSGLEPTVQFTWSTPSGTSSCTGTPPACSTYTATQFGFYTVTATGQNGCSSQSNSVYIKQECPTPPGGTCVPTGSPSVSITPVVNKCGDIEVSGSYSAGGSSPAWSSSPILTNSSGTPASSFVTTVTEPGQYYFNYSVAYPGTNGGSACTVSVSAGRTVIMPVIADVLYSTACTAIGYNVTLYDHSKYYPGVVFNSYSYYVDGVLQQTVNYPVYNCTVALTPGSYTIKEVVNYTFNGVTAYCEKTKTINLPVLPVASFTMDRSPNCTNVPVYFTNTTAAGTYTTCFWDFDDGSANTQCNPQRTYQYVPGQNTFYPNLTVKNSLGCSSSVSHPVTIVPNNLNGSISPGGPFSLCERDNVVLNYTPGTGTATGFNWKNGNQNSLVYTSSITVNTTGSYWLVVSDNNKCEKSIQADQPVNVEIIKVPQPIIRGGHIYCANEAIALDGYAGADLNYIWNYSGLTTTGPKLSLPNGLPSGTYFVTLGISDKNGLCYRQTQPFEITVNSAPATPVITTTILNCNTYELQLSANVPGVTGTYAWSNGLAGSTITVNTGGPYEVTFTGGGSACTSKTAINLSPKNPAEYMWMFPTGCITHCPEDRERPITLPAPIVPFTYWDWLRNNSSQASGSGMVGPLYLYPYQPGTYNLVLSNGCEVKSGNLYFAPNCYETDCRFEVSVRLISCGEDGRTPEFEFIINNVSGAAVTYNITPYLPGGTVASFGGVAYTGSQSISVIWQPESYPGNPASFVISFWLPGREEPCYYRVHADFECEGGWGRGMAKVEKPQLSIGNEQLKIYPNPARDRINISYNAGSSLKDTEIELCDMQGRMLRYYKLNEQRGNFTASTGGLAAGMYIVRLKQNGAVLKTEKLIISGR